MARHRMSPLVALLALGVLALPACGSGSAASEASKAADLERATTTTSTTVPTTTTAAPAMPLTGLPIVDPAVAARPALVIKIDNIDTGRGRARPQSGLNQADVVYEELVEGGITRLFTVFHSTDADPVGPVRSARTSDIAILGGLNHPLFAWSGANDVVIPRVHASGAVDIGFDAMPEAYYRRRDRRAPHNMYTSTPALYGRAPAGWGTPQPLFTFRAPDDYLGSAARPVAGVDLGFGGGLGAVPVQYRWDPAQNGWARTQAGTPHVDEAGVVVAPQNVIVQFVPYGLEGADSPVAEMVGTGPVWVFTNGHLVEGRWSKPFAESVTEYVDRVGTPIGLTPGRTWVAVLASGGSAVGTAAVV